MVTLDASCRLDDSSLKASLRGKVVYDIETRASDHQPVLVEFDLG